MVPLLCFQEDILTIQVFTGLNPGVVFLFFILINIFSVFCFLISVLHFLFSGVIQNVLGMVSAVSVLLS